MSSAAVSSSSVTSSHSGVLATPAKSKVDKFFDVLRPIVKIFQKVIGTLAVIFSIGYSSELLRGLIAFGVPLLPAAVLQLAITYLFIDYMVKKLN